MIKDNQIISKGIYQYNQIARFVSVKDFIFSRKKDKKCLSLRFVNSADFVIESMSFTLIQLNSSGECLGQTKISCPSIKILPGAAYAHNKAIVVDEYCCDFKVVFSEAVSGSYTYTVHNGNVTASYDLPQNALIDGEPVKKPVTQTLSVKRRSLGKPKLAVFLAIVALLLTVFLSILQFVIPYVAYLQKVSQNEVSVSEYTFEDNV